MLGKILLLKSFIESNLNKVSLYALIRNNYDDVIDKFYNNDKYYKCLSFTLSNVRNIFSSRVCN